VTPRRAAVAAALIAVLAMVAAVAALSTRNPGALVRASAGGSRPAAGPSAAAGPSGAAGPSAATIESGIASVDSSRPAPELVGVHDFDNTPPVSLAALRGRVVLVDFWTYTCVNCRRTFPFLRALSMRYAGSGLTVLGVHSPEFGFEKQHANVARAVQQLGVTWPVAEDPEMKTWSAYGNQYWPGDYLVDRQGRIRYMHYGEGDDEQLEAATRALLAEGGTVPRAAVGKVRQPEHPGGAGSDLTAETYFGAQRGARYLAGEVGVAAGATVRRHDGVVTGRDVVALEGSVTGEPQALQLGAGTRVTQQFKARDVYLTAAPSSGQVVLDVTLDGRPVPAGRRGPSLRAVGGRTVVVVGQEDLFHLLTGPAVAEGTLRLTARTSGVRLFTFTYGG
jgi:thiol-disulfide isomerase/thioredoxin